MKKITAILLAILMVLMQAAVIAETVETEYVPSDTLVVGNPTQMHGQFFTSLWGNNGSDADVRDLLHGYNLIMWDHTVGAFTVDPSVVSGLLVMENDEGDRSYIMTLYNDLYYSDGTKINAWDYAFSYLLQIAPEIAEIGGTPLRREHLVGYQEYVDGTVPHLTGVRVLADDMLMVTISHEYLPFFYEFGLLMCNPYPIHVIAPGVDVADDGEGVYLTNLVQGGQPVFSADLLRRTILDPDSGYLSHPSVVSGPYTLVSWDGETARFRINTWYKGNKDGVKPTIPNIVYTRANYEDMIEKLQAGEFSLLNKVVREDAIQAGTALIEEGEVRMNAYPRSGLSYISFNCERAAAGSQAVRQAIAWCFDREAAAAEYTGSYGLSVDGYYGLGQWMYGVISGTTAAPIDPPEDPGDTAAMAQYEEDLAAYEALSLDGLTQYTVDTDQAAILLDADGWQLNDQGIRQKEINGQTVLLDLTLAYPEGNTIADQLNEYLVPNLEAVGIRLTLQAMPLDDLLTAYYRQADRDMDMIYMATNFDIVFDPSVNFVVDDSGKHNWSYTSQPDTELYELALAMRQTEPGDVLTYCQNWIAFQERFNQVLPMLPIYSNIYFDFYTSELQDYEIASSITWGQAAVKAWFGQVEEEEELVEEEGTEDGSAIEIEG